MANELRLCAGCNRDFIAYASAGAFWCVDCRKRHEANRKPVAAGDIVRHFDGPDAIYRYVVRSINGDALTVRRLGFPESPTFAARLGEMVPE